MDAATVAALQADLVSWGVLEPDALRLTRRARAALARAAVMLREEEVAGQARLGHPMVLACGLALEVLASGKSTAGHEQVLAAIELASLPDGVRDFFSAP